MTPPLITCKLKGGLGNQMFQIFNALRNALKYNCQIIFTNMQFIGNRSTYWLTMFDTLQKYTKLIHYFEFKNVIRENTFEYRSIDSFFLSNFNSENILLDGYFQSPKYFEDFYSNIYEYLKISEKRKYIQKNIDIDFSNCVSMHFRLGDYKYIQNHHPILSKEYYIDALHHISLHSPKTTIIFFCCEKEDIHEVQEIIFILKDKFPQLEFIKMSNTLKDWEQMLAMSCCRHHIIANSTFSWWGAFLNPSISKIVCYPSTWFGPALNHHNTSDLFPTTWTKI